jgi:hypothetical protein
MQSNVFLNLTSQECSKDALPYIQKDLEERLKLYPKDLNEESLKDALHFTNMKFLKSIKKTAKGALSCVIVIEEEQDIYIAGIGHYKVYALDDDFCELVFQDPLNAHLKPGLDDISLLDHLKNALGRPSVPLMHVRKIKRTIKPNLIIAPYDAWSQASTKELKSHPSTHFLNFSSTNTDSKVSSQVGKENTPSSLKLLFLAGSATSIALGSTLLFSPSPFSSSSQQTLALKEPESQNNQVNLVNATLYNGEQLKQEVSLENPISKKLLEEKIDLDNKLLKNNSPVTFVSDKPNKIVHTVSQGETLTTISQKYYGSSKRARDIFEANKEILPSQNHLKAGTKLVIP